MAGLADESERIWVDRINGIIRTLRSFRRHADFEGGHKYFLSISQQDRQIVDVAIEAARLYLAQGHLIRAEEACAIDQPRLFTQHEQRLDVSDGLFYEDTVCFELLRAQIDMDRHCKLTTSFTIGEEIFGAWLSTNARGRLEHFLASIPSADRGPYMNHILESKQILADPIAAFSMEQPREVSEYRILIESYCYEIRIAAESQGLVNENAFGPQATNRLKTLYSYLVSQQRFTEAREVLDRLTILAGSDASLDAILQEFENLVWQPGYEVELAFTLLDLARRIKLPRDASQEARYRAYLDQARRLFEETNHGYGCLDVQDTEMPGIKGHQNIDDWLKARLALANKYFAANVPRRGISVLLLASSSALSTGGMRDTIQDFIKTLESKIGETGDEIVRPTLFVLAISQAVLHTPEHGPALRSLEAYIAGVPYEIGPTQLSQLYLNLRRIHSSLGDHARAYEYAKKAYEVLSTKASYVRKSKAALELALAMRDCGLGSAEGSEESASWLASSAQVLEEWAETDGAMGYVEEEMVKCIQLAEYEDHRGQHGAPALSWTPSCSWSTRLLHSDPNIPIPFLADSIVSRKVTEAMKSGNTDNAVRLAREAFSAREEKGSSIYILARSCARVAMALHAQVEFISSSLTLTEADGRVLSASMTEAVLWTDKALKLYRRTGNAESLVRWTNYSWKLLMDIRRFEPELADALRLPVLNEIKQTEDFCDEIRRNTMSENVLESLKRKRYIVSQTEHRKLYSAAALLCVWLGQVGFAWRWIQKGKARGLSDVLGLRSLIPADLLAEVEEDEAAKALLAQERQSSHHYLHASPEGTLGAARKLDSVRREMRKIPTLKKLLAWRESSHEVELGVSEFQKSLQLSGLQSSKMKFVDWWIPLDTTGALEPILLLVRGLDGETQIRMVDLSFQDVQDWIRKVLCFPEGAEPPLKRRNGNALLSQLDGLVKALDEMTAEDDLLVLSPSGILSGVPIHALKVGGRVLIDRNPVIYTSSVSLLCQCSSRAATKAAGKRANEPSATFMAAYEDPYSADEREAIFENIRMLAESFLGTPKLGTDAIRSAFHDCAAESSWIHYHGHATYNSDNPLDSSLVLSDGNDVFNADGPGPATDGEDHLTVSDIFTHSTMKNSPHFTLIACDSGTQDIGGGDEPLGLISALLYAGATSVLGCLWPIESAAGRTFSEKFHKHIKAELKTWSGHEGADLPPVLRLAEILRTTVREMMDKKNQDTRLPYHWAPFVLHGCWYHVHI